MAKLKVSVDVPIPPDDAWAHTANLAALGDWLTMHEAWRGAVPDELVAGTQLVGIASVKGLRNRVTWTVQAAEPPRRLVLRGAGKGGTKLGLELLVAPKGSGSEVTVDLELGGAPLFGPIGAGVARAVKGDIHRSLEKFVARYA
ncbi:SRPBCC family protein [Nocardia panacis]|uniref:SRPBCC family protein n=1 Tax=Nocardia panacis TaxID=2340916 RepID=A0A3A4K588_9NOCA|nr:SRPBCC family protein [Nocardia panacis]RJO73641.1 SRPBCC family protein [Nocardia panacis]